MSKSTADLAYTLAALTREARARGFTDTDWANRAKVRKETLSRLRSRQTCDFETLRLLAEAVGARLGVLEFQNSDTTSDGHFPAKIDRDYEDRLLELCASHDFNPLRWSAAGPRFFMAGVAVMLASVNNNDRRKLLLLAEQLHPGASEVAVFNQWLARSPLRPTRFLSLLDARARNAA